MVSCIVPSSPRWVSQETVQRTTALLSVWGSSGSTADFHLDGVVGAADLAALLSNWADRD